MADNEDIEGETDWSVGINHQVVTSKSGSGKT
jgi:hypothetical protein